MENFDQLKNINSKIYNLFKNKYFVSVICFLLAIYISFIQVNLTEIEKKYFKNPILRIFYLFVIIFIFNYSPIISILFMITFLSMTSSLSAEDFKLKEKFGNLKESEFIMENFANKNKKHNKKHNKNKKKKKKKNDIRRKVAKLLENISKDNDTKIFAKV